MATIIETTLLECDKSSFLLDLTKHDNGLLFVQITQSVHSVNKEQQTLKINPSILGDLIRVLKNYEEKIPIKTIKNRTFLTEMDKESITNRYFKGVSIKDIAMQFEQKEEDIIMVLRNKGIEIIPIVPPKSKYRRWRKK